MKKPFETYITFIEHELGVKLLDWQKKALRDIYNGYLPHVFGLRNGKYVMCQAAQLLVEEINRDMTWLPPRLYDLDGYSADVVTCDEDWRENIELEKENKI